MTLKIWISDTQMALCSKSPAEREKSPACNARTFMRVWEEVRWPSRVAREAARVARKVVIVTREATMVARTAA